MTDRLRVLILHGPNLNLLGVREPAIYGSDTLDAITARLATIADSLGVDLETFQSNHEGALIDRIHAGHGVGLAGGVINPGGLTHSSVSLHDAIKSVDYPFIEVHLSNLHRREPWRQHSVTAGASVGVIMGLGWRGYELAIRALAARAREEPVDVAER
ncbi:MAG: type II 3-dehydroquinate dehydratase [Dehalococcoidia bacterium]|nr:type II 3-dehydroquinate dehydratase [Dehalococcoidia bacterium]